MVDTETYTVEGPDGDSDTVDLPAGLVDMMAEQGEEPSHVISDVVLQAFAQQAHAIAHHSQGETPADVEEINAKAEELFEERFGRSLQDAMGHSH
ncbi:hypothetical protein HUG10_08110 [Halorarum halophilum]|uniref:Uncharacterized protein n=1 Tax=Halorarum halophilum TaxID=2743090 RepID=A0A7D5KDN0_9EURY|nr:hypothetical protein [Halobaculum halophilum]QLG27517.1 hypothetical protein HUG10_08110 [Halobaculum halophilum]